MHARPSLAPLVLASSLLMPDSAWAGCLSTPDAAGRVVISPSLTEIPRWAFTQCHSLKTVEIHASVTSIGLGAFSLATALESVVWQPDGLLEISSRHLSRTLGYTKWR